MYVDLRGKARLTVSADQDERLEISGATGSGAAERISLSLIHNLLLQLTSVNIQGAALGGKSCLG